MKTARLFVAVFLAALLTGRAGSAPVPADAKDEAKTELARLTGTWELVSFERAGQKMIPGDDTEKHVVTFKKDGTFAWADGFGSPGKVAVIDPSKKVKEIDYLFTGGPDEGETQKAIYKLDGDTFTDCCSLPGVKERPTEFKSTKENKCDLLVYKRVKKID